MPKIYQIKNAAQIYWSFRNSKVRKCDLVTTNENTKGNAAYTIHLSKKLIQMNLNWNHKWLFKLFL